LLGFAQRERFPKSGSPWWVLFPVVDLVYMSRTFKGISQAEAAALGKTSLPLPLVRLGLVLAVVIGRFTQNVYGLTGFIIDLSIALTLAGYSPWFRDPPTATRRRGIRKWARHQVAWPADIPGVRSSAWSWAAS
jgi:hypothetical protein